MEMIVVKLIGIGCIAGVLSGFLGIGGGILIVPLLISLCGFVPVTAVGTSLAVLLPPIGIMAAFEYYRRGHVDVRAAIIIAISLFITAWLSARYAQKVNPKLVQGVLGLFLVVLGLRYLIASCR